jgi:hypothetical protein
VIGLGLAFGLAILLSACGEIAIPGFGGGETPAPAQPTAAPKSGLTAVVSAGQLPAGFPSDFPLPPQHQVQSAADDGRQMTVVLVVPSAPAAYDFYKSALPGAGYQLQDLGGTTVAGAFSGGLTVSGKGVSGEVAITAVGPSPLVSIRLERGGAAQPAPAATAGHADGGRQARSARRRAAGRLPGDLPAAAALRGPVGPGRRPPARCRPERPIGPGGLRLLQGGAAAGRLPGP